MHLMGSSPDGTDPGDVIHADPSDLELLAQRERLAQSRPTPEAPIHKETWGELLRHRLGINEADSDSLGFTEAPSNAWFTATARERRLASKRTRGPWGVFTSLAATTRGRRALIVLEVFLTLSVFSGLLAIVFFPYPHFAIALGISIWSGRISFAQVPLLESLDDEEFIDLEAAT